MLHSVGAFGGLTGPRVTGMAEAIPIAGKAIARMLGTVQVYRLPKTDVGRIAFVVSLAMALCYVTSYWLVSQGLPIRCAVLAAAFGDRSDCRYCWARCR